MSSALNRNNTYPLEASWGFMRLCSTECITADDCLCFVFSINPVDSSLTWNLIQSNLEDTTFFWWQSLLMILTLKGSFLTQIQVPKLWHFALFSLLCIFFLLVHWEEGKCSCSWQIPAKLLFSSHQCHSDYSTLALNKLLGYGHLGMAVVPVVQRVVNNRG